MTATIFTLYKKTKKIIETFNENKKMKKSKGVKGFCLHANLAKLGICKNLFWGWTWFEKFLKSYIDSHIKGILDTILTSSLYMKWTWPPWPETRMLKNIKMERNKPNGNKQTKPTFNPWTEHQKTTHLPNNTIFLQPMERNQK